MELLISLFKEALRNDMVRFNVSFNGEIEKVASDICFQALVKIHDILDNPELSDFECIEEIVCTLEDIGFNGGSRHDFG